MIIFLLTGHQISNKKHTERSKITLPKKGLYAKTMKITKS